MAATPITVQPVAEAYTKETETQFTTLTMTAMDPTNMNEVVMPGRRVLALFQNSDAVNAEWVTVFASNDAFGRSTNINQQPIPASGWLGFIFEPHGWEQADGGRNLLLDAESVDVKAVFIPL